MSNLIAPRVTKLPFFAADTVLIAAACFVYYQSKPPLELAPLALIAGCVALAAFFGLWPFVLDYRSAMKLAEAGALTTVLSQTRLLEKIEGQIREATGQWQTVQAESGKTVAAARGIAERMSSEVKGFTEFMQRAGDNERAALRLENDKLRRAESEWLHVVVKVLDHVYALHQGALRSGQPTLVEQMGRFQNACREAARRVGLVSFAPARAEQFDPERHQVMEGDGKPAAGTPIGDIIASGYTFQGRMLRQALVRLEQETAGQPLPEAVATGPAQDQLPLQSRSDERAPV